mgnify:FL=1
MLFLVVVFTSSDVEIRIVKDEVAIAGVDLGIFIGGSSSSSSSASRSLLSLGCGGALAGSPSLRVLARRVLVLLCVDKKSSVRFPYSPAAFVRGCRTKVARDGPCI